ncbi:MAG: flagellar FliJ family protein [Phycisphaera sp.]|nr:MAG: flagellar FliJ family protein [Phycisphaera sp.]
MARRFAFELEVVLEQRRRAERDALGVLAMAQNERAAVEAEMVELRGVVEAERDVARELMVGRVSARSLREHVAGELGADRKARALAVRLAGVQKRIDKARELLREASVGREAIEKLRERRYKAWVDELEKAERLELDDLFVMRRGHTGSVEG